MSNDNSLYLRFLRFFGFEPKDENKEGILIKLLHERAPFLLNPLYGFLSHLFFFPLLRYSASIQIFNALLEEPTGLKVIDRMATAVPFGIELTGEKNILPEGTGAIAIANHPTGISDGIALHRVFQKIRSDYAFIANSDAIRAVSVLKEIILPVELTTERKTHAKTRQLATDIIHSVKSNKLVTIFPSGRMSYLNAQKQLEEHPWNTTAVRLSRRYSVPIIPIYIECKNSFLYYFFSKISTQLRDACVFYEMVNKGQAVYKVRIAPPVEVKDLPQNLNEATDQLRNYILSGLDEKLRPQKGYKPQPKVISGDSASDAAR